MVAEKGNVFEMDCLVLSLRASRIGLSAQVPK
jgi:hypothetical protein